ncbi:phage terminase small subunit [Bradyrhizobium japonicum]|nr:phage terminase small subunit [Bradyrhizobium japonicum]
MIWNTGIAEPDWRLVFSDAEEIAAATELWRIITTEMFERGTLAPSNAPLIFRLIVVQTFYDRAARQVGAHGAVVAPRKGNSRAIPRINPHFSAMTQLSSEARALEGELGLSPRTRAVKRSELRNARRGATPADEFLRLVPGGGRGEPIK